MTRIEKLRHALPDDFQAALVTSGYNRAYLANFISSAGTLLVTPADAWLLVDFRYYEMAKAKAEGVEVLLVSDAQSKLRELLDKAGIKRVMIETETTIGALA